MKSRRYFLKECSLAATGVLLSNQLKVYSGGVPPLSSTPHDANTVTLLHTSDFHSYLQPFTHGVYSNLGGLKKIAPVISKIKNQADNVVLLDAGDIFSGNLRHQKDHEATLHTMHSLNYDAALLGNRDYEAGIDYLQQQWKNSRIDVLGSNYSSAHSALKSFHKPYKIIQKGNIKIGIIAAGINMKGLVHDHVNREISYRDPLNELNSLARMLKAEQKCQLVICLSHLGFRNQNGIDDISLATGSKNIDVIIGGHSHTFMQAPFIALNQDSEQVIINHAGLGGMVLGNLNISFDNYGNKNMMSVNNLMIGTENNSWVGNSFT